MSGETSSDSFRPKACPACRKAVIWARFKDGNLATLIPVETCAPGKGDIALSQVMFGKPGDMMEAQQVDGVRTKYRSHRDHCPKGRTAALGGSFSGGQQRKERPA